MNKFIRPNGDGLKEEKQELQQELQKCSRGERDRR